MPKLIRTPKPSTSLMLHGEMVVVGTTLMLRDSYTRDLVDVASMLRHRFRDCYVRLEVTPSPHIPAPLPLPLPPTEEDT